MARSRVVALQSSTLRRSSTSGWRPPPPPDSPASASSRSSTSACATKRADRRRTSGSSWTTTDSCWPRSRPCTDGRRRAGPMPRSAAGARTSPTSWPTTLGCRYLQAIGSVRGLRRRGRGGLRRAVRPGRRARPPRRHRVAAVHQHRDGGRRAGDRRGGRPAQRRVLRRHLAPPARSRTTTSMLRALPGDRVFAVQMDDGPRAARSSTTTSRTAWPTASRRARASSTACGSSDCCSEIGVRAPISLEVCSTELWAAPAAEAATKAADAMRAVLARPPGR